MSAIRNFIERMGGDVPWRSIAKEAGERSWLVAKFLCFCHVTNHYLGSLALVYGPSMLPTINLTGDLLLVERISPRIGNVSVGDIVLVRSPEDPKKTITKRITGMEGDTVSYAIDPRVGDHRKTVVVPKGHVFVQGDNIFASHDSRNFGAVPHALIRAKALIRVSFSSFTIQYR
ncbi:hypothetical protein ACLOJK_010897 [Asimina triloba]